MPTTDLPDLEFTVVRILNNRANILFTLPSGKQLALEKKLALVHKKLQDAKTVDANHHNHSSEPRFDNGNYSDMSDGKTHDAFVFDSSGL